jgi:hypothetical protein
MQRFTVKMETRKREKKVLPKLILEEKEEEKKQSVPTLNKNVEKAVIELIRELKEIGYDAYLKTPQCPDGLFRRHVKPVLISELEKERL